MRRILNTIPILRAHAAKFVARYGREIAMLGVVFVHAAVIYLIVLSLNVASSPVPTRETTLSLVPSGPWVAHGAPAFKLQTPTADEVAPPHIVVADDGATVLSLSAPTGGSTVTIPAEAISGFHNPPKLPADLMAASRLTPLRIVLTVQPDGMIASAQIDRSSGSAAIDAIALAWVKAKWRYKPALRNGIAIAETTTAIVPFEL